jgi:hypothetical protein
MYVPIGKDVITEMRPVNRIESDENEIQVRKISDKVLGELRHFQHEIAF